MEDTPKPDDRQLLIYLPNKSQDPHPNCVGIIQRRFSLTAAHAKVIAEHQGYDMEARYYG